MTASGFDTAWNQILCTADVDNAFYGSKDNMPFSDQELVSSLQSIVGDDQTDLDAGIGGQDGYIDFATQPLPLIKDEEQEDTINPSVVACLEACKFCLVFPQESPHDAVPKSRRPHYSDKLKVLFVKEEQQCPFTFSCDGSCLPEGVCLRAVIVYIRREDAKECVRRCADHSAIDQDGGTHLMSSRHEQVVYDISGGQLSVVVPYFSGQEGELGRTFTFEFACRSSCKTPLKHRPMQVVFTLEKGDLILGKDTVVVKVSSSPYRDMKNAEEKLDGETRMLKADVAESARKRKLKSSSASWHVGDETYQAMVQEDIAFAQYARQKHPEWWNEYHKDLGSSFDNGSE